MWAARWLARYVDVRICEWEDLWQDGKVQEETAEIENDIFLIELFPKSNEPVTYWDTSDSYLVLICELYDRFSISPIQPALIMLLLTAVSELLVNAKPNLSCCYCFILKAFHRWSRLEEMQWISHSVSRIWYGHKLHYLVRGSVLNMNQHTSNILSRLTTYFTLLWCFVESRSHYASIWGIFLIANHTPDTSESTLWQTAKTYMRGAIISYTYAKRKETLTAHK